MTSKTHSIYDEIGVVDLPPEPSGSLEERLAKIEVLKKVNKPGVESYLIADELRNLEGTKDE